MHLFYILEISIVMVILYDLIVGWMLNMWLMKFSDMKLL